MKLFILIFLILSLKIVIAKEYQFKVIKIEFETRGLHEDMPIKQFVFENFKELKAFEVVNKRKKERLALKYKVFLDLFLKEDIFNEKNWNVTKIKEARCDLLTKIYISQDRKKRSFSICESPSIMNKNSKTLLRWRNFFVR